MNDESESFEIFDEDGYGGAGPGLGIGNRNCPPTVLNSREISPGPRGSRTVRLNVWLINY